MFSDFFAVCWDIIANEIAKTRYMTNGQVGPAAGDPHGQRRRATVRRAALAERRELGDGDPRPQGRRALDPRRRDRAARRGGPRPGPGRSSSSTKVLYPTKGEVPDGEIVDRARRREGAARRRRRHDRARWPRWCRRALAAAEELATLRRRGERRRRPVAGAARHRHDPRLGRAHRRGCSPSRRTRGCAAGAPRSSRSSSRRSSTTSTARRSGSPRRTCRCRPPTPSRTRPSPRSTRIVETVRKAMD